MPFDEEQNALGKERTKERVGEQKTFLMCSTE